MTIIPKLCENCGKPLGLFDESFCVECIQGVKQALNEVKHEQIQPHDGDRAISLNAVIDAIEFFQMNPQHFDFVNLIDDIKELPSVSQKGSKDE